MAHFVCPGCGAIVEVADGEHVTMRSEAGKLADPGRVSISADDLVVHQCAEGSY